MAASSCSYIYKIELPLIFLALLLLSTSVQPRPFQHLQGSCKGQNVEGLKDLKRYLHAFGYLNYDHQQQQATNIDFDDEFDDSLESAIKTYQQYYRLNVTGTLDQETVDDMMKPRCGVPDHVHQYSSSDHLHTVGRFAFFKNRERWPDNPSELTYRFSSTARVPEPEKIQSIVSKAFQTWSHVTRFTFWEVPETFDSDIVIGFHRGAHGDNTPFDGPARDGGGVLAHAYPPTIGMLHYDADENWSSNPAPDSGEFDLQSVALHEIGHVLGLEHSGDPNAIMFAKYQGVQRYLSPDDIQGIQTLYGLMQ